jgi:deazaflavin-dependent oxidoreductase (nitroreductase family)
MPLGNHPGGRFVEPPSHGGSVDRIVEPLIGSVRPNTIQRLIQRVAATPAASAVLAALLHRVDRCVLWASHGRATATSWLSGLPVVVLTTTGARSGRLRSVPLVGLFEGGEAVVVASNFGSRRHPSWCLNLRARPEAVLTYRGRALSVTARETAGDDYDRYWAMALQRYSGFQAYARRSRGRRIPIILLHPRGTTARREAASTD